MKKAILFLALVLAFGGCAFFKQAKEDYQLGKATPYVAGEVTVDDQAHALTGTVSGIPYVNLATPLVALTAPMFFFWLRGRRIRKQAVNQDGTAEGSSSLHFGVNEILNIASDLQRGIFEMGADGSSLKRGWKMALLTTAGFALAPEIGHMIPFIQAHHPAWMDGVILSGLVGLLAAAEKALSKLKPNSLLSPIV
jgi:hypothetical protein